MLGLLVRLSPGAWISVCCGVCRQVEVSATSWSLVQRSPTDCGVSEYDHEPSIMRRPWPTVGGGAVVPKKKLIWTFVSLLSVATRRLITNNLQYCMAMLHNLVLLTSFWVLKFLWAFSCRSFPTGCGWHPCNKRKATSDYKWQSKCWYRSFVRFRPVKNPLQLADGPTVYVRWQGEGICLVASANHLSVSL